ncbi:MAG: hypothetical protein WDN26_19785 [Chitinophagaceae bacterium]
MNNKSAASINKPSITLNIISWLFGTAVLAAGIINTFWGNDPGFGVFLIILSFVYFLPVNAILKKITGFSIPRMGLFKIVLALFIIWVTLGVGELFGKIDLMMKSL